MRTRRIAAATAATLLALTALTACGDDSDEPSAAGTTTTQTEAQDGGADTADTADAQDGVQECSDDVTEGPASSKAFGEEPEIEAPTGPPPCELIVIDLEKGEGAAVTDISKLYLWNYEGVSWSTGEVFDTSFDGTPATFALNRVIPGWTEGLQGIKPGGRRMLVIPPEQAYGAQGRPGIAPNETLVFVVDLVEPA